MPMLAWHRLAATHRLEFAVLAIANPSLPPDARLARTLPCMQDLPGCAEHCMLFSAMRSQHFMAWLLHEVETIEIMLRRVSRPIGGDEHASADACDVLVAQVPLVVYAYVLPVADLALVAGDSHVVAHVGSAA